MKLKKGSAEAKRYMAKIRAKKKPVKKATVKKLSGIKKNRSLGASGDYAKFEIAVIKNLSKLLKKPYKKVLEIVNTDDSLLSIISKNFDKKVSVSITAKELKAKLITVAKKSPLQSFVEILNKLPKKDQVSRSVKFPIKLPATVQIGSNKKRKLTSISGSSLNPTQKKLYSKIVTDYDKNGWYKLTSLDNYVYVLLQNSEKKHNYTLAKNLYEVLDYIRNDY